MSTKKNKKNRNKREHNIKSREERLKDIEREDSELDEIEKLIAENESDDESENENTNEVDSIETEETEEIKHSETERNKEDDKDDDIEDDFFAQLEKEDIKTFKVRKKEKNNKRQSSDGVAADILKFVKGNTKYAIWGSVLAVLMIALIIALAVDASNKDKVSDIKKIEVNTSGELIPSDDKEIVELVKHYYKAMNKCDTATLENILESAKDIDVEMLKSQSEYIESYNNIKCYLKQGLKDDEYVVYVCFEIKILDIETPAPGAYILYIKKSSDGSYKICNDFQNDDDIMGLINKLSKDKDVVKLFKDVDEKLAQACEKDAELKEFYDALMSASDQ